MPFHPYSYNRDNLILLLEQFGFEVKKISYNGSWVGIIGGFQILMNLKNKRKSNEGWMWNKIFKVIFHQFARLINLFHQGDCIEITFIKK